MSDEELQNQLSKLQKQIHEQQKHIDELGQNIALLHDKIDTLKFEGCWRYYENPNHEHRR